MAGNYTALSNFKLRSRNQNLTVHFATGYRGVTIGNEYSFGPTAGTGQEHVVNGGTKDTADSIDLISWQLECITAP